MSDEKTPRHVVEIDDLETFELNDEQLDAIAGGEYIPAEERYICDNCGAETECLGVNHQFVVTFQCPNCGRVYGVW